MLTRMGSKSGPCLLRGASCFSQLASNNQIWLSLPSKHLPTPTSRPVSLVEFLITRCIDQGIMDSLLSILLDLSFIPLSVWSQEDTRDLKPSFHSILGPVAPTVCQFDTQMFLVALLPEVPQASCWGHFFVSHCLGQQFEPFEGHQDLQKKGYLNYHS